VGVSKKKGKPIMGGKKEKRKGKEETRLKEMQENNRIYLGVRIHRSKNNTKGREGVMEKRKESRENLEKNEGGSESRKRKKE